MAVYHSDGGMVCALEPLDGDCWVEVFYGGAMRGRHPIERYDEIVDWAKTISRQFLMPIQIVPISPSDLTQFPSSPAPSEMTTPEQRHADRRAVVNAMCEVLRDCPDEAVRADAYDVLKTMKVIQHV